MTNNTEDVVGAYWMMADTYHNNALELAGQREFRKATEMLWGAVTQRIKALAAARGIYIKNHGEFFTFIKEVSKELGEPNVYQEFLDINALHKNFYDQIIPDNDFDIYLKRASAFEEIMEKLFKIFAQQKF